jgi:2-polyprenyl-3-methyl-5-hydroxy-6-metoxy-1,4-benzoquinol methylase
MFYLKIANKKSHLTAIHRRSPSSPLKFLLLNNNICGRVLDYGCGHGADVSHLKSCGFDSVGYDPHWNPDMPIGTFDTILCTYVLNTITEKESEELILSLEKYCKPVAKIFIATRTDVNSSGTNSQRLVDYVPHSKHYIKKSGFNIWKIESFKEEK